MCSLGETDLSCVNFILFLLCFAISLFFLFDQSIEDGNIGITIDRNVALCGSYFNLRMDRAIFDKCDDVKAFSVMVLFFAGV